MLAVVVTPAVALAQNKDSVVTRPEVVKLTVKGVKSVDKSELLQNLSIAESKCVSLALTPICWISKSSLFYKRRYLNHDELARDVIRARVFYWQRGYREATIDTVIRPAGRRAVKVTLAIHEGAPTVVTSVDVTQTHPVLSSKSVQSRIRLEQGKPLNVFNLDSTRTGLRNLLWERGYSDARVDTAVVIDTATRSAQVSIKIEPRYIARVKSIAVEGNEKVSEQTIRRSLSFAPGDIYKRSAVLESQRSLYESNLFRRAAVEITAGRRDSLKAIAVSVSEAPPRETRLSAGFNTIEFVQLSGRFTHYNWLGGARRLNVVTTVGNLFSNTLNGRGIFYDVKNKTVSAADQPKYFKPTFSASLELQQPWFGSPRNNLSAGIFTHRRSSPGIFIDKGYGATATFTRQLTARSPLSLNYRFEVTTVDASDVYFCVSNGICDDATLVALRKAQRLSPLALTLSVDQTNDAYQPREGYRGRIDGEHASSYTASDFRYNRTSADAAMFLPVGRRSVLAGHLRGGYVNALKSTATAVGLDPADLTTINANLLHPRKRFYLGGASSVRGFGENQLGPRVLTISPEKLRGLSAAVPDSLQCTGSITLCDPNASFIKDRDFDARPLGGNIVAEASVEFRFPVYKDFMGAVFVDGGYLAQNTDKTLPKSRAAATPGVGVRYLSPAGPIRVDIGWNPIKSEKLSVVTEDVVDGVLRLVALPTTRTYSPTGGFLSNLTLHLSIGEAY